MTLLYLILGLICFAALFGLTELVARTESESKSESDRVSS
jgi:hypothetical protein